MLKEKTADGHHALPELFAQALTLHRTGRLREAALLYRDILGIDPEYFDALHMLGVIELQGGRYGDGLRWIEAALRTDPRSAHAYNSRGNALRGLNRPGEALASFERALVLAPDDAEIHCNRANLLLIMNRPGEALASYDQALALQPRHALALNNRGNALQSLHRMEEALASYDRLLEIEPQHLLALNNRGNVLKNLRRPHEALVSFDRALALKPDFAEAHNNRGLVLQVLHHLDDALASFNRAAAINPGYVEAYNNRGLVLQSMRRYEEALASFDRALALRPDNADALINRGVILFRLRRHQEALANLDRALALRPTCAEAYNNRGNVLKNLYRYNDALASFDRALALNPDFAEAHNNRGLVLQALHRFEEALACFDRALVLRSDYVEAHNNRGAVLQDLDRPAEALASYERLLAFRPEYADALLNRGWEYYEGRRRPPDIGAQRGFAQPLWRGEDIAGKTVLLHAEQGFGDTLQFCRYAAEVARRGARVILEVPPPLKGLLSRVAGVSAIVGRGEPLPDFDVHCPLTHLPPALKMRREEDIPQDIPYLTAAEQDRRKWAAALGPWEDPRVGIVWSGDAGYPNDRNRSMRLEALVPLLETGVRIISLQKEVQATTDRAILAQYPQIERLGEALQDFDDTAGLIENLDVVIAVDTAAAHLAGALGKPVWVLLPYAPDWRWQLEREDSPWYPTARLFRQPAPGDWTGVVRSAAAALANFDRAAVLRPSDAEVYNRRGMLLQSLQRPAEALVNFDRALALRPDYVEVFINRGVALYCLRRSEEALANFDRALALRPDLAEAHNNRGNVLKNIHRLDEALASFDRALALKPDLTEAHNNRGSVLKSMRRLDEALASFDRALANLDITLSDQPGHTQAYNNRGLVLQDLNRLEEALASYAQALAVKPDFAEVYNNRGTVLYDLLRFDEALDNYRQAEVLQPDAAEPHNNEALCLLVLGDYARGWEKYEWRWKKPDAEARRPFTQPLWLGKEDVAGKTVLLYAEQGFGDTLQFCRYAAEVARRGARVVLEVQPLLKELLSRTEGVDTIVARGEVLPPADLQCPLMSLPLALGTTVETIPARVPYVRADARISRAWQERLGARKERRVGIVWSGNAKYKNDHNRSMALEALLPLLDVGVRVISLQKDVREVDRATLAHYPQIERLGEGLRDFDDTAGLIENLDMVIAVDTAVAHLAGALGKPVWVLLPYAPDWRWLLKRVDSPWYPTARLFRQPAPGDWGNVVRAVTDAVNNNMQ